MARVKKSVTPPFGGKLSKKDEKTYRVRNGKQHVYTPSPNSVPPTKAQKTMRATFGKITSIVNAIMADPRQSADWELKRLAYNKSVTFVPAAPRYKTLRSFVHAMVKNQLEQSESKKRRKAPVSNALPKGLKLHIKHFADLSTTELYELLKARFAVFYMEQHIYYQDFDNIDYNAIHLALHRKGSVIAYARLFAGVEPGQWVLGRMLTTVRSHGYGRYIMYQAISEAQRQGAKTLILHAQLPAVPFYEKFGFRTFGEVFNEADLPHVQMRMTLSE